MAVTLEESNEGQESTFGEGFDSLVTIFSLRAGVLTILHHLDL